MIVRSKNGRIQIAVLEDSVLVEHYVARNQDASLIGNVYLGRVQNVLPSMEAAFVDIGRGRNAVLYSGEVDWDAVETGNQPRRIELALKSGDRVLVQVTKDPVGHKGARLTSQISLPGRYLVYVPGGAMNGISRKLPDTERARLKKILKEVLPESSGVIVRTAAEGATEDQLTRDVQRLTTQWEHISRQVESIQAPALLHSEPDLLVKIVRDVFNEDFTKMLIQGEDAHQTITAYLESVAPDLLDRIAPYEGEADPFDEFRVTEQIEKALDRKVWLPSGGSLVIDRTEAMTVVDVNTGKFVGSGGNLEETVTKNNLEAAEEIVRQLPAARHRRHHRGRLHRHGARIQPRSRAAPAGRVPEPRPHEAPGRRGHLARTRADDPQEARPRPHRDLQRAVRGLRRPRNHHPSRPRRQAPRTGGQRLALGPPAPHARAEHQRRHRRNPRHHGGREVRARADRGIHDPLAPRGRTGSQSPQPSRRHRSSAPRSARSARIPPPRHRGPRRISCSTRC